MGKSTDLVEAVVPKKKGSFLKAVAVAGAVFVGVRVVTRAIEKKKQEAEKEEGVDTAYFTGRNIVFAEGDPAHDLKLKTLCGGIDVDMRRAVFTEDIKIDCEMKAGGISIWVPEGVNVEVEQDALRVGGIDNKTETYEDAPTIYVTVKGVASGLCVQAAKAEAAETEEAYDETCTAACEEACETCEEVCEAAEERAAEEKAVEENAAEEQEDKVTEEEAPVVQEENIETKKSERIPLWMRTDNRE